MLQGRSSVEWQQQPESGDHPTVQSAAAARHGATNRQRTVRLREVRPVARQQFLPFPSVAG